MANWANPLITTQYDVFVAEAKERDVDAALMDYSSSTNIPAGTFRFNRTTRIFQEWTGAAWANIILGVTGGGTGASSGAGAGTSLGLGTMAYQNSNAINVTGGGLYNVTALRVNCILHPNANNVHDLGFNTYRWKNVYIGSGLVIPVGLDKYVVG